MTHNPKLNNLFAPSYEQDTENSEENRIARDHSIKQSKKGEELVSKFLEGEHPFPEDKQNDQIYLSNLIMQLLHLRYHNIMLKKLFNKQYFDDLKDKNDKLSKELYLKSTNRVKYLNELEDSNVINYLLSLIIRMKIGKDNIDKDNRAKSDKMFKICNTIVKQELIQAKFMKSAKSHD